MQKKLLLINEPSFTRDGLKWMEVDWNLSEHSPQANEYKVADPIGALRGCERGGS